MADAAVLVTGAAGFIGARFVASCTERGIPVVSADHPAHFAERAEHRGVDFGEIVDREALFTWLAAHGARLRGIVHLGACTDTTRLDRAYLERVNVEYSQRLWRFAAGAGLPLVYASSAATYGDGSAGFEDDEERIPALRPLNPYAESKQRFDLFALAEAARGAAPPAWSGFKFFNVYGPGERHKGPMASMALQAFDQIRARGAVRLFRSHDPALADGAQRRDFVSVHDVVAVLHFALARPLARGIFNLGTGRARSFLDLARAVFAALDASERIEFIDMPPALRARYQAFTEAPMRKLRAAGYEAPFAELEQGVGDYVRVLLRG
ncbi:MAG TPA: ADP-glyceromanno-heptose 6-epimerase [Myxococcota bacterium]|nr:ADP-glyceromanno-heptose 6-epimerase [Myxococcota bacterium]